MSAFGSPLQVFGRCIAGEGMAGNMVRLRPFHVVAPPVPLVWLP